MIARTQGLGAEAESREGCVLGVVLAVTRVSNLGIPFFECAAGAPYSSTLQVPISHFCT